MRLPTIEVSLIAIIILITGVFFLSASNNNYIPPYVESKIGCTPERIPFSSNVHTPLHPHVRKSHFEAEETVQQMLMKPNEKFEDYAIRLTALANKNMTQWFLHQKDLNSFEDVVHVTTSFRDNYVYWLLTAVRYFFGVRQKLELVEPEEILYRGYGFCSQHALLIARILERQGIQARIHELNGHVVPEMITPDGQSFILDTNAKLVLSGTVTELAEKREYLEEEYFKARLGYYASFFGVAPNDTGYASIQHYAQEDAQVYAELYTSQEDNEIFLRTDDYVNFWEVHIWRISQILKYFFPILIVIMLFFLFYRKNNKVQYRSY